jgi:MFS family permease
MANGAFSGLITVYATLEAFPIRRIGLFAALGVLGGIALQLPIGHLSDRVPRRRVIFGCALAGVIIMSVAATLTPGSPLMYFSVFLFGGILYPMYSLSISHINDVLDREQMLGAAAAFMFIFGVGAIIGPIVTAFVMDRFGPSGFFLTIALYYLPVAGYALWRIFTKAVPNRTDLSDVASRAVAGSWAPFLRRRPNGDAAYTERRGLP